jgi:hypothetical protein
MIDTHMEKAMGRFQSEFNQDLQKLTPAQLKARRSAASKLAAAVGFGLEHLEERALFTVTPVANPGGPYTVNEGSSITLNASGSTGSIVKYEWDLKYNGSFVDQVNTSNPQLSYTAGAAKTATIALEVVDSSNTTSAPVTGTITINDVLPVITVTGGGNVNRGDTVPISWTYVDPGKEPISNWVVDWGDGTSTDTLASSANSDSHVYASDGTFTITVTSHQSVLGNDVTSSGTSSATVAAVNPVITLTGDSHVNELASYTLGFSAVDPSGIDTWAIDWGDGSQTDVLPGTATTDTHTYATHGTYTVTATAIDPAGDSSQAIKTVIADDVAPAPTIAGTPGAAINEGDTISLTATPNDPGSATTSYAWTVTKDGQPFTLPNGTVTNASTLSFVAGYKGSYVATVVVTDDANETGTVSTSSITANAVAPTVAITGASTPINKGDTISLTATPSDPGTGDTYTYLWSVTLGGNAYTDLGGASTTGSTFSFVAGRSGNYIVSVTVTDRDNGTGSASTGTIVADAVAPTVSVTGASTPIGEGTAISLTATPTDTGTDESFTYNWTVTKDGNAFNLPSPINTSSSELTFTPEDQGTYVATCTVTDSDGTQGSGNTGSIVVQDVAPTVSITGVPGSINEGTAINLTANPSEASSTRTYSYAWSVDTYANNTATPYTLPNGAVTDEQSFSFTPPTGATYIIHCTVTDDEGGQTTASSGQIAVANVPPTSTITGTPNAAVDEGTAVNLSASGSEPGSGHTFTYQWSVSDQHGASAPLSGGVASASDENGPNETAAQAFDGNINTKWLMFENTGWLEYDLGSSPAAVTQYNISSASDWPTRDPQSWQFQGSNNGSSWTTLDTQTSQSFSGALTTNDYPISNTTAYRYYRLNITANDGAGDTQLSELTLLAAGPQVVYTSSNSTANFTPVADGPYTATLTTTDENSHSSTQTVPFTVANVPPTVTIAGEPNSSITEGTAVALTSTETEPGPGGYTYAWSVTKDGDSFTLPNGVATNTSSLNFTPVAEGAYVASLDVTDSEGGTTTVSSTSITVTAAAPIASMTGVPQSAINEFSPLTLGVTASDVNPANTDSYSWSVTKNNVAYTLPSNVNTTGSSFTFTPDDANTWQVSCVVTNSEGQSTTVNSGDITVDPIAPTASITLTDGTRAEGNGISATAVVGSVGTTDTVTYAWSVQRDGNPYSLNGVVTSGSTFSFTPSDQGSYQIFLTATDSGGPTSTSTSAISVADVAPGVTITGAPASNTTTGEGTAISLGTTVTETGANDSVASYAWTVTKDGQSFDLGGAATNASTLTFTPVNAGVYVATVTVTNASDGNISGGQTQVSSSSMTVVNVPPTVVVTGTSGPVTNGTTLNFSAAATEPGSNTLSYAWTVTRNGHAITLANGIDTTSSTLSFAAGRAGSFIATCTVTDSEDGVGSDASNSVTVTDVAPSVTISGEPGTSIAAGTAVALTAAATDPGALERFNYSWSVTRNGLSYSLLNSVATNAATLNFTPDRVGSYIATVTVTDTDGGTTTVSSTAMAVNDVAPTVTVTGPQTSINEGQTLTFTGSATNPTIDDTFNYSWAVTRNGVSFTLPNGTSTSGTSLSFTVPTGGTYIATASVTDSAGSVGTGSAMETVNYVSPTVSITGTPSQSISAGSAVSLAATPAEAGSGHTFTYAWSVTRNGVAYTLPNGVATNGASLNFHPGRAGSFVATVLITDEVNATVTASTATIHVGDVRPPWASAESRLPASPKATCIDLTATPTLARR